MFAFIINVKLEGNGIQRAREKSLLTQRFHGPVSGDIRMFAIDEVATGDVLGLGRGCVSQLWVAHSRVRCVRGTIVLTQLQGEVGTWCVRLRDVFYSRHIRLFAHLPLTPTTPSPALFLSFFLSRAPSSEKREKIWLIRRALDPG